MSMKILFVCTGNTCRSPMAEGLLRRALEGKDIEVVSAGTGAFPGASASAEAVEVMREEGIDISAHTSRLLDGFLLEDADRIFVMTEGHLDFITSWFKSMRDKMWLLREFDPVKNDGSYPNIPDPIGASVDEYRKVKEILKRTIAELEKEL